MSDRSPNPANSSANSSAKTLIAELATDLEPVSLWQRPRILLLCWLLLSVVMVVVMSLAHAPWRPGAFSQLASAPRFSLEIGLAFAGICTLAWLAVQSAVPGALSPSKTLLVSVVAWAPWLVLLWLGLEAPALVPSMVGKRESCYLEVMVESLPPLIYGLLLLRRLYPLSGIRTGILLGAASGMVPALLMQLSCMYIVEHAWSHHLAPVLVPVVLGALAGGALLKR